MDAVGRLSQPELAKLAAAWLEATCSKQGIQIGITDPRTVGMVARIVRGGSDLPDRLETARVEAVPVGCTLDVHAAQDGADNGSSLVKVEVGPALA